MIKYIFIICSIVTLLSCNNSVSKDSIATLLSSGKSFADSPNLTFDNHNNPVFSWVEGNEEEETFFHYSILDKNNFTVKKNVKITATKGLSAHHESMPKIAFKDDGTILVVYSVRNPSPTNRFAGAIHYIQSFDDGQNWTSAHYLHGDTTSGIGRNFFDITTLPDGEVGAIWLDGRKKSRSGSTLFFAKTKEKEGFINEIEIAEKTCQCCRTDIYVDAHQNINVAYRDIINDSIRDIAHLISTDIGLSFSTPKCISPDNWVINGCPHTGPSMTWDDNGLHLFWFTEGQGEGVYHTTSTNHGESFSPRNLLNAHARHPQATTLSNGNIAVAWDETFKTETSYVDRIGLRLYNNKNHPEVQYITGDSLNSKHPVLLSLEDQNIIVAWTQQTADNSHVYYKIIEAN